MKHISILARILVRTINNQLNNITIISELICGLKHGSHKCKSVLSGHSNSIDLVVLIANRITALY